MKMKKPCLAALLALVAFLVAAPAFGETKMRVAVQKTQIRASAAYLGAILGTLSYGDGVTVLTQPKDAPKDWLYVLGPDGKTKGWVNVSALTTKAVNLASGGSAAATTASSGDVALAGKGFNSDVEAEFKSEQGLDYTWVDRMQAYSVASEDVIAFRNQGGLAGSEVAQ